MYYNSLYGGLSKSARTKSQKASPIRARTENRASPFFPICRFRIPPPARTSPQVPPREEARSRNGRRTARIMRGRGTGATCSVRISRKSESPTHMQREADTDITGR